MHISEGVLSYKILCGGALLSGVSTWIGLKKLDLEKTPRVAVFTSGFFVASLIHVPIGPSSAHLILNGLLGLFLGWVAFPAILVGLILQAVMFQFGGITTLGVNTFNMAFPAVICFYAFRRWVIDNNRMTSSVSAFLCGALAVMLSAILVSISLALTGMHFLNMAKLIILAHIPIMVIEGLITAITFQFLKRVRPEILEVLYEGV